MTATPAGSGAGAAMRGRPVSRPRGPRFGGSDRNPYVNVGPWRERRHRSGPLGNRGWLPAPRHLQRLSVDARTPVSPRRRQARTGRIRSPAESQVSVRLVRCHSFNRPATTRKDPGGTGGPARSAMPVIAPDGRTLSDHERPLRSCRARETVLTTGSPPGPPFASVASGPTVVGCTRADPSGTPGWESPRRRRGRQAEREA